MKETELAKAIVEWLETGGWDVYQEVLMSKWGMCPRCDIYAKKGGITWAIECKLGLGFSVLAQAQKWMGRANFVSVAVKQPQTRHDGYCLGIDLARDLGISVIEVVVSGGQSVDVRRPPRSPIRVNRRIMPVKLDPKQKTMGEAGNAKAKYYSPFRWTVEQVKRFLSTHPGATIREIMDNIDHHYSSDSGARSAISNWINQGIIKGIERERDGRVFRYYLGGEL